VKAIPVIPLFNPHPMTTRVMWGFRLLVDKLMLSATSLSLLSSMPTSVSITLTDLS
jgi:hypothetical protein